MKAINFGCGLSVAPGWTNYDASPTLMLQRLPVISLVSRMLVKPRFPDIARYGDVVRGLKDADESADFVYCSHVLEHLSLSDARRALVEVMRILKPGGIFRGVLPDLESETRAYLADANNNACSDFMRRTYLGLEQRPRGLLGLMRLSFGNSQHLWMWDYKGLKVELERANFINVRRAEYGDSLVDAFGCLEEPSRWDGCLGFECVKPSRA